MKKSTGFVLIREMYDIEGEFKHMYTIHTVRVYRYIYSILYGCAVKVHIKFTRKVKTCQITRPDNIEPIKSIVISDAFCVRD